MTRKRHRPSPAAQASQRRAPTLADVQRAVKQLEGAGLIEVDWEAYEAQTDTPPEHRRLDIRLIKPRSQR